MSEQASAAVITTAICSLLALIGLLIYFGATNATNRVNTRLDHIGTACATAGNIWLNNNCVPSRKQ